MDTYKQKILNEISLVPDHKLKDLFEIIQSFRHSVLNQKLSKSTQLLGDKFAGTWLGDEKAEDLAEDLIDMIKNGI